MEFGGVTVSRNNGQCGGYAAVRKLIKNNNIRLLNKETELFKKISEILDHSANTETIYVVCSC